MKVRLGFSVAAHLEPEILVVDEVLAVGDAEFQKKAIGKMQDVSRGHGRTVLFVSHNMGAVRKLCYTGILLEDGTVTYSGKVDDVVERYLETDLVQTDVYYPQDNIVKEISAKQIRDRIELSLKYESDVPIKIPTFGFVVYDNYENPLFGTNPSRMGILDYGTPRKKGEVKVNITYPHLVDGTYPVSVWFCDDYVSSEELFQKDKCVMLNICNMNNSFVNKGTDDGPIIPSLTYSFI